MKFISGFFKVIAVILAVVVVLTLPAALLGQSAGRLLFSPSRIIELVNENLLNSEVMASLAAYSLTQGNIEEDVESPYVRLALEGLKEFNHEELVEVVDLIAPPELIAETMHDIVNGYYLWINSEEVTPVILIDITGWKDTLGKNFVLVAEMVLSRLPDCNSSELMQYSEAASDPTVEIPQCKPPEPQYSDYLVAADQALPAELSGMDNTVQLFKNRDLTEKDWMDTKEGILGLQVMSRVAWIAILFLYVLIIPLGARSFSGVLKWAGWPMLLAGGFLFLIALIFFAPARTAGSVATMADSGVPPVLHAPMRELFEGIFVYLARPLLAQSIAMMVLGSAGIGAALYIDSRDREIYEGSTVVRQEESASPDSATVAMPELIAEQIGEPLSEEGDEDKDDSQPSGMFG